LEKPTTSEAASNTSTPVPGDVELTWKAPVPMGLPGSYPWQDFYASPPLTASRVREPGEAGPAEIQTCALHYLLD
jgi:hypothetical protein